jgi:superfamily II DNA/RNA helicase
MAPTRELALQIHAEALKFGASVGCRAVAVYGGAPKERQISALRRGCELIIGTPGRIKDILDTQSGFESAAVSTARLSMLVLDEADRMLDMGFERDIRAIVWQAFDERPRQTFLYSATWPEYGSEIQTVANDLLSKPVKITVGSGGERLTANKSVTQRVHVVDAARRMDKFEELIATFCRGGADAGKRVIVFANMKITVKKLAQFCKAQGLACESMSGDRSQSQRESTIRKFKSGQVTVVIATDVAARGLDIKGIERVINYELPVDDFQDYVHRIGRTGRAGMTGESDSLFTDGDKIHSQALIKIMSEAGQTVPRELSRYAPQKIRFD